MANEEIKTKRTPLLPAIPIGEEGNDPEIQRNWRKAHADSFKDFARGVWFDVREIKDNITSANDSIANLQGDIANNTNDIANLANDVSNNANDISNNANSLADVISDVSNNANDIANNANDIANNANAISNLQTSYIKVSDVKSNGTEGGTFTSGSYQVRTINTEDSDTGNNCSISANQITLAAGTYECYIRCPAFRVASHKARLYNTNDTSVELLGSTEYTHNSSTYMYMTDSKIQGRFTIASQKTFEIQHRCGVTQANVGFGQPCSFGDNEVYTVAEFWKVA